MTYSRWNSLGRGGLKVAILLAVASTAFAASPVRAPAPSVKQCPLLGEMVVVAPRLPRRAVVIADLGAITVSASRQTLIADLGTMTVVAARDQVVADLGSMQVTATREEVVARNAQPAGLAAL